MISAPLIEYLKKGIFTLLGLILAVYLFVILMTYTGNDPSWSHISSDMTTINNVGGASGAWLSDLLYSFFGFGAWWLLAFLVYESILIWWDNKPTFWLMRLIAYVFLLLSASALFAQLVALVQQVTDPTATRLEGVAGGIIGLELQSRLAQLLSQWGSVLFLTAFVIITATFAFNIHWLAIYQKVTALSWLGSGVKHKDMAHDSISTQEGIISEQNDESIATNKTAKETSEHEQLPLELPSEDRVKAVDNTGRFSNVLSEFLSTSGLADSVKASMAAATQAAMSNSSTMSNNENSQQLQTATAATAAPSGTIDNTVNHANTSPTSSSVMTPIRKVEPSFAWNDANTVDDLLASEQMAYNTNTMNGHDSGSTAPVPNNTEFVTQSPTDELVYGETDHQNTVDSEFDVPAESIDTLADAWLAEHADISVPTTEESIETPKSGSVAEQPVRDAIVEPAPDLASSDAINRQSSNSKLSDNEPSNIAVDSAASDTSPSVDRPTSNQTEILNSAASSAAIAKSATSLAAKAIEPISEMANMTPTNTPPANPTLPPTVVAEPPKSNISFDIPEGDSSNHIADMVPDDTGADAAAPVMPHISDDAAFSTKSRSMQTAAYRSSLSPIPEMSILDNPDPNRQPSYTEEKLVELSELLEIKLQEFNVKASVVNAIPGPVVTRFEVELAAGVKASKVTGISRDLARSLSMASLRVVEVIPGKPYIGIEVPNPKREMVRLIELLNTEKFKDPKAQISMAMGKDIGGKPIITDLARAPHMLVAGTTGSGKSVLVNSMLLSMLLKYTPNELRLILIDPKQLELANYNDIPHLLTPVVTDMTEAASALSW